MARKRSILVKYLLIIMLTLLTTVGYAAQELDSDSDDEIDVALIPEEVILATEIDSEAEFEAVLGEPIWTEAENTAAGYLPKSGGTMTGALDLDNQGLQNVYQQVVVVAKAGADYATIQGAIDSITDATTTKRYMVKVESGVYTESITMKDYVDIIGAGRTNTIIAGTSGTVLTFPANKGTVSEVGINVNYGTLGAASTAITSAGADSVLKDCDITVTKSGGDFVMNGLTITAGSFRMSDSYFTYTDTSGAAATLNIQSAIVQTGVLTTVILNNNEFTISTTDTNDGLVAFESTANVTGLSLLANNVIKVTCGAACTSAAGLWLYGTSTGAVFNQNRLTVDCDAGAYGLYVDSASGGATIDTRHNEFIITGTSTGGVVAVGDTWNSSFDYISATTLASGAGTITREGIILLSDCSGIKSGTCLDTDDGKLYSWDGDSVELVGVLDYAPIANDIQSVLDCASGACPEIYDAPAPIPDCNGEGAYEVSVDDGHFYITANTGGCTIADFIDDKTNGHWVVIIVNDANTTFDFTDSGLEGNDKDFTAANGAAYMFLYSTTDSKWHYLGIPNAFSANVSGGVETETIYIEDPTTETFDEIAFFGYAVTITRISCITDTGTASINFENGADNVLSAELVCDSDEQDSCASGCDVNTINGTYDNFSQYSWGDIDISATASSPTKLSIAITFTRD